MIPVSNLAELTLQHIEMMLELGVAESSTLDYKSFLPDSPVALKALHADVCAFVNANGGDILFGIEEKGGKPVSIDGVEIMDLDDAKLRLSASLSDGIEPRIQAPQIEAVPLPSGKFVLVLRVGASWNMPHRTITGTRHFYVRSTAGNQPMDIMQIRTAFVMSESLSDRIRAFQSERFKLVSENRGVVPLRPGPKIVVHAIPLSSFLRRQVFDSAALKSAAGPLQPLRNVSGWTAPRPSLEGVFVTSTPATGGVGYTLLFRNGVMEIASVIDVWNTSGSIVDARNYETPLIQWGIPNYLKALKVLNIEGPLLLFIGLFDLASHQFLPSGDSTGGTYLTPYARGAFTIPEALIEDLTATPRDMLHSSFEIINNAFGA